MNPLNDDEAALLYTIGRNGSDFYPIQKAAGRWYVGPFRSWSGFSTSHKTRKAAVAQFESWADLARERWAEMKQKNPDAVLTAVGVRWNATERGELI